MALIKQLIELLEVIDKIRPKPLVQFFEILMKVRESNLEMMKYHEHPILMKPSLTNPNPNHIRHERRKEIPGIS